MENKIYNIAKNITESAASTLYKKMNEYTDETKESFNTTLSIM